MCAILDQRQAVAVAEAPQREEFGAALTVEMDDHHRCGGIVHQRQHGLRRRHQVAGIDRRDAHLVAGVLKGHGGGDERHRGHDHLRLGAVPESQCGEIEGAGAGARGEGAAVALAQEPGFESAALGPVAQPAARHDLGRSRAGFGWHERTEHRNVRHASLPS